MVRLPPEVMATIVAHARAVAPEEGCGLLAVDESGEVRHAYCLGNVERSPVRFTIDPDGHFAALRHTEAMGWIIGGDFHSHPRSAALPSRTDVAGALDPDWLHVIVGLAGEVAEVRAWRIRSGEVTEEPVAVTGDVAS
ncbi:MAG TPA: hypothetical protein DCY40_00460 [Actinobacteria bacterium]|nr:hypothetical protein [Actinomycetota bacterium]